MIDMKLEKSGNRGRYVVREKGSEIGSCDFSTADGILRIINVTADEPQVADGVLRASLFWAMNSGINDAVLDETMDTKPLARTSFSGKNAGDQIDITKFFAGGCNAFK